jgi:hypothetical protein
MLHKGHDHKGSVAKKKKKKKIDRESEGAWRQDELIGGKPPVIK